MMKDHQWVRAWPNVGLLDSGEASREELKQWATIPRPHLRVRTMRSTYTKNRILNRLSPRTGRVELGCSLAANAQLFIGRMTAKSIG